MKQKKKWGCWILCLAILLCTINPGYAMTASGEESFRYLIPDELQIPFFYEESGTIQIEEEEIPVYRFSNETGETIYYRVYGQQGDVENSTGFYGCDHEGTPEEPLTRYTQSQDEVLRGKTAGNQMIADGGIVTNIEVGQFDGTESFDSDDEPGNDSSDSNGIVRSFDSVIYSVTANMKINDGEYGPDAAKTSVSYNGGVLYIRGQIPEALKDAAAWDVSNMQWAREIQLSEDRLTVTAAYQMDQEKATIPGRQELNLPLNIFGAANGTSIQPSFTMWLEGNETDETQAGYEALEQQGAVTTVSARPAYNVTLRRNIELERRIQTSEFGTDDQQGRMYGYGIGLSLVNNSSRPEKSLKGMEFPSGDITFDLNLRVLKSGGIDQTEDITNTVIPRIWNYNLNGDDSSRAYPERDMNWGNATSRYEGMPGGRGGTHNQVYDSGQITMTADPVDPSIVHVTVSDYQFNGEFPNHYLRTNSEALPADISNDTGYFAVSYVQFFVPFEENREENASYEFSVEDTDFSACSISGNRVTTQVITSDDQEAVEHFFSVPGSYIKGNYFSDDTGGNLNILLNNSTKGQDYARLGQIIAPSTLISSNSSNTEEANSVVMLSKFDDKALEPVLVDGNGWIRYGRVNVGSTKMQFHMLYAVKKDGTGWESDTEMYLADMEDLEYYDTYEEWQSSGKVCVGVLFESNQEGSNGTFDPGRKIQIDYYTRVRDTAQVDEVYQICNRARLWYQDIDTENRWSLRQDMPTPDVTLFVENEELTANYYAKTQYDENGSINKSHRGSTGSFPHYYGNSLLIVGAEAQISKVAYDPNSEETDVAAEPPALSAKANYDLDKNETTVYYAVLPEINSSVEASHAQKTTATICDILPQGVTYKPGSGQYQGQAIEPQVEFDEATGTTQLTWVLSELTVGETISPIFYQAVIDPTLDNGSSLNSTVTISIPEDNREESYRENAVNIQVVNLASHRLYKEVGQKVYELGEAFTYDIHYRNNTNNQMTGVKILDVLPYNGDGRGSDYHGSYRLAAVDVKNGDQVSIYYTTQTQWQDASKTIQDADVTDTSVWKEYTGETAPDGVTAVVVQGDVAPMTVMDVSVTLNPTGNELGDVYGNDATMTGAGFEAPLQAVPVSVVVVSRKLNGKVWLDADGNGRYDTGEELITGVTVRLTDQDGNPVSNIYGEPVEDIVTGENGTYSFQYLAAGTYKVQFIFTDGSVLDNRKITAKQKTDVPVSLNSDAEETIYSAGDHAYAEIIDIVMPSAKDIQVLNYIDNYEDLGITPVTGSIALLKTDDNGTPLADVRFDLYKVRETDVQDLCLDTYMTGQDGRITVDNLQFGSYYFVEKAAPEGYEADQSPTDRLTIDADNYDASNSDPLLVTKVNQRKTGTLLFTKTDQNGNPIGWENSGDCAAFRLQDEEGQVLEVYGIPGLNGSYVMKEAWENANTGAGWGPDSSDIPQLVTELITDSQGRITISGLPWDDARIYTLAETRAPKGYHLAQEALTFKVTVNVKNEVVVSNTAGGSLTLKNSPETGSILFEKQDETGSLITEDTAQFVLRTAADRTVKMKSVADGVYELSGSESENTESILENAQGKLELRGIPWNEVYKLMETKAPRGYQLSQNENVFQLTLTSTGAAYEKSVYPVINEKTTGSAALTKRDETGQPITGDKAVFELYDQDNQAVQVKKTAEGVYQAVKTEDAGTEMATSIYSGQLQVEGLPWGSYYFQEKAAPSGYRMSSDTRKEFTLTRDENGAVISVTDLSLTNRRTTGSALLTKVDTAGQAITGRRAQFQLSNQNTVASVIKTGEGKYRLADSDTEDAVNTMDLDTASGTLEVSGLPWGTDWQFTETAAPAGYLINQTPVDFVLKKESDGTVISASELKLQNEKTSGKIRVVKQDQSQQPITSDTAEFKLYQGTLEHPLYLTGSNGKYSVADAEAEEKTEIMETGREDGAFEIAGLHWSEDYLLVETKAPAGYLRQTAPTVFQLSLDETTGAVFYDGNKDHVEDSLVVSNEKSKGQIQLTKVDGEQNPIRNNRAVFGLYEEGTNAEITVTRVSDGIYKKSEGRDAVTAMETGADGTLMIQDMDWGIPCYLKELQAPSGYEFSSETIPVLLEKDETGDVISQTALSMVNTRKTGILTIRKTDAGGDAITSAPARFQLFAGNENGEAVQLTGNPGNYQMSGTSLSDTATTIETGRDGKIVISGLDWGRTFYLKEVEAPAGYEAEETFREFRMSYDSSSESVEEQTLDIKNNKLTGQITVVKKDEYGNAITNNPAGFTLYDGQNRIVALVREETGTYRIATNGEEMVAEAVTGADGTITITGIQWGVPYFFWETEVPTGYILNENAIIFTLTCSTETGQVMYDGDMDGDPDALSVVNRAEEVSYLPQGSDPDPVQGDDPAPTPTPSGEDPDPGDSDDPDAQDQPNQPEDPDAPAPSGQTDDPTPTDKNDKKESSVKPEKTRETDGTPKKTVPKEKEKKHNNPDPVVNSRIQTVHRGIPETGDKRAPYMAFAVLLMASLGAILLWTKRKKHISK